jgi:hypothetical protein
MPWAQVEAEPLVYGREMLPASDFEKDAGPWRVEAWKGKAAGRLDTSEHHGGTRSMRVDVPVESGDAAITVLVWPQWGGGGLNLALEGGKTYEFAAWVKLKDRLTPPELRVNVPSTAVSSTRGGQESVQPDGWRRIWMRFETTGPTQPNYIAVWLPGIGTLWVDGRLRANGAHGVTRPTLRLIPILRIAETSAMSLLFLRAGCIF